MYNFINLDDAALDALIEAANRERDVRTLRNIDKYPEWEYVKEKPTSYNCIEYRHKCKMLGVYVTLSQALTIVNHYRNKANA